ncbi:C25 family cysteine peptidase [Phycisphaeraceae bacterium D3-23]
MPSFFCRSRRRLLLAGMLCLTLSASPALAAWSPPLPEGVEPQVLLITDESLAEAWQDFAVFKTRLGRPTTILTVQEIDAEYEGDDIQQKIRAAVQDYIENHGSKYIVLGGDSAPGTWPQGGGLVPDRDTVHRAMRYRDIPTDLYYLSPGDNDWDANANGVYGEWPADMEAVAYTHPSGASIGRIPVRTAEDVAAYTDKVVDYETNYPAGDFAEGLIYSNTVDGSEPKVRRSWDDYVSNIWPQGEVFRFYHTETYWDEDETGDYALNTEHWLDVINNQTAGKMHMHGHGMLGFWVLEDDGGHTLADQSIVDRLTNGDAYLVMTTVSCFTGQYDGRDDPSITESMLRAPNRGAVAILAPSREGVPIFHNPREDFRLMVEEGKLDGTTESMTRYWMAGLSPTDDGSYRTLGEAFITMKGEMAEHAVQTAGYHWCQCELSFLGDPTLDMRANAVVTPEVGCVLAIPGRGVGGVTYGFTTDLRTPMHATACVWNGDDVYVVVPIGDDGKFNVWLPENSGSDWTVTVSGPSLNAVTLEQSDIRSEQDTQ